MEPTKLGSTFIRWVEQKMAQGHTMEQSVDLVLADIKALLLDGGLYEEMLAKGYPLHDVFAIKEAATWNPPN